MASKNIRDVKLNVDAKQLGTAARNADKLNKALASTIETVKGSSRSFTSISNSMKDMASSVKAVNRAISSSTSTTKGLENYKTKVGEARTALMNLRHEADNTLKAVKSLNTALNNGGGMVNMRDDLLDLKDGIQKVVEEMQDMNKNMRLNNIYTIDMEESLGKLAQRTKQVRENTGGTASAIDKLTGATKRGGAAGDSLNQSLRGLAGQGRSQARSFSELAFKMNPLTSAYASIAINVYAAAEAFRVLSDAANLERLLSQTATFSAAVSGINVKGLARDMMELSGGALSLKESLSFATKGTAFNFTTEQLEKLTVGARKASIALGRDFSDSMDRVLRGISKQEIELFDELGVVTRLTPAFEAYAASVNKSVDELSDYERQLALTNEVQKQLDTKFSGITVTTTEWERLGKATQNALDNMLMGLQDILKPLADSAASVAELVGKATKLESVVVDITESSKTFTEATEKNNLQLGSALVAYGQLVEKLEEYDDMSKNMAESLERAGESSEALTTALQALAVASTAFLAVKMVGYINAASVAVRAFMVANRQAVLGMLLLNATSGKLTASLAVLKGAMLALARTTLLNPAVLISVGLATAAVIYFKEEIQELADFLLDKFPGLESVAEVLGFDTEARKAAKQMEEYKAVLEGLGIQVDKLDSKQLVEMGAAYNAFTRELGDGQAEIDSFITNAGKIESPIKSVIDTFKKIDPRNVTASIKDIPDVMDKLKESFEDAKDRLKINPRIENASQFVDELEKIGEATRTFSDRMTLMRSQNAKLGVSEADTLVSEIQMIEGLINKKKSVTGVDLTPELTEQYKNQAKILKNQLEIVRDKSAIEETLLANSQLQASFENSGLERYLSTIDLLQSRIDREKVLLQVMESRKSIQDPEKDAQRALINNLESELRIRKKMEVIESTTNAIRLENAQLNNTLDNQMALATLGGRRASEELKASQAVAKATIEYNEAKAALMDMALTANPDEVRIAGENLAALSNALEIEKIKEQAAAFREVAEAAKLVAASTPGMTGLQSEFMNTYSTIASTIANVQELAASGTEATLKDFSSSITSVGSMAANIFSELTNGIVSDIDAQIAAEKARDGKSQESLAKIRQLERKKIKEQEKSKIAQTAMATSLSIMNAYAELGPIAGSFAAAGLAALGVLQVNNIKKASAGQLAALDPGTGTDLSVTVGSRANTVDLAQRASIGEAAYLRGDQGVGSNANSFIPGRSGGGSVIVGERGPERITPLQPINVQPASKSGGDAPMQLSLGGVNIHAIDSQSFAETAEQHAEALFVSFQKAASARGINLDRISAK